MEKAISPTDRLSGPVHVIERRIYLIRGQRVMLDSDLAELYQVETRALVQSVKRNIERFPEDFMFQLTTEEAEAMRSQTVIASKRNIRYQPYAFTEHGVAMLSAALKSDRAVPLFNFANCWPPTKSWPVPSSNTPRCCNLWRFTWARGRRRLRVDCRGGWWPTARCASRRRSVCAGSARRMPAS